MKNDKQHIILEVNNLKTSFVGRDKTNTVVQNFNLILIRNETLAIIGETGSGKTISILSSLGLLSHLPNAVVMGESTYSSGNSAIDLIGSDHQGSKNIKGKEISIVFQNPQTALDPLVKCGKQVIRVIRKHLNKSKDEAKRMVLEVFSDLEFKETERIYNAFPHQLSGGELQRVMVAMAISCRPKLLVLDEPTASLDLIIQAEIIKLLKAIQEKYELTIILISHNLSLIADIADRILHIFKGDILEVQETKDFFMSPIHERSKALLATLKTHYRSKYLPQERNEVMITVHRLNKYFGSNKRKVLAINNVSLNIYSNEKLGIIGESGSGKSTLGKCIAGIIKDYSGEIRCQCDHSEISYIFQSADHALDPELSVKRILFEVLRLIMKKASKKEMEVQAIHLLNQVKLESEILERIPSQLSGGQRQRVNLARTLAIDPQVIICDEITSGLDLPIQLEMINLLKQLAISKTIIFISHDIFLVKNFCDRIVVMKDGEIKEIGKNQEIFQLPTTEYARKLVASIPKVKYFLNT